MNGTATLRATAPLATLFTALGSCAISGIDGHATDWPAIAPPIAAALSTEHASSGAVSATGDGGLTFADAAGWIDFPLVVTTPGRYRCDATVSGCASGATIWVEDYIGNPDGRCYDITAPITVPAGGGDVHKIGSPLDTGARTMRFHYEGGPLTLDSLSFALIREHALTPRTLIQNTDGGDWSLVWADEFEGTGHPNPDTWTYDIGNWGWGNREPQFYTAGRLANARRAHGNLIIEAHRDDLGQPWTSARLTTRGKMSFLYGRVELRAKVPAADGTWAAAWFLGDAYRDEKSWPYCGEIDVLEGVGREIDDASGDGLNHASCHTRAFYFKQGNHISETIAVPEMSERFHVYAVEWTPDAITMWLDGEKYYVYDKKGGRNEWPFDEPQNLVLNLAIGGGMGGAIDPAAGSQQFVIDYVRVYGRR